MLTLKTIIKSRTKENGMWEIFPRVILWSSYWLFRYFVHLLAITWVTNIIVLMYKYDSIERKKIKAWINPRRSEMSILPHSQKPNSSSTRRLLNTSVQHCRLDISVKKGMGHMWNSHNSHEMKGLWQSSQCFVECSLKEMQRISYS